MSKWLQSRFCMSRIKLCLVLTSTKNWNTFRSHSNINKVALLPLWSNSYISSVEYIKFMNDLSHWQTSAVQWVEASIIFLKAQRNFEMRKKSCNIWQGSSITEQYEKYLKGHDADQKNNMTATGNTLKLCKGSTIRGTCSLTNSVESYDRYVDSSKASSPQSAI
jgi:hypothetical protein